jgi:hypothetical protein
MAKWCARLWLKRLKKTSLWGPAWAVERFFFSSFDYFIYLSNGVLVNSRFKASGVSVVDAGGQWSPDGGQWQNLDQPSINTFFIKNAEANYCYSRRRQKKVSLRQNSERSNNHLIMTFFKWFKTWLSLNGYKTTFCLWQRHYFDLWLLIYYQLWNYH